MPILGIIDSSKSGNLTPTAGYISLATFEATSAVSSLTFSSIPSIYKHLELRANYNENVTNNNAFFKIRFNNDQTSANYLSNNSRSYRYTISGSQIVTTNNATYSGYDWIYCGGTTQDSPGSDLKGFASQVVRILNYSQTYNYKSASGWSFHQASSNDYYLSRGWGSWKSTAAINRIDILIDFGLVTGSTFSLYGIA